MAMAHPAAKAASLVPIVDAEFEALIPPLQPEERTALEKSILRDGCRDALVVWKEKGILLDGHNRFAICKLHGRPYMVVEQSFADRDDAKLWMLRNQLGRRNLQPIERIGILASVEKIVAEKAKRNQEARKGEQPGAKATLVDLPKLPPAPPLSAHDERTITAQERPKVAAVEKPKPITPIDTRAEMAKMAGVSEKTYDAGKKILETGSQKLQQAVRTGDASIHAAAKIAAMPKEKQDAIVAQGPKAIVKAAKEAEANRTQFTGENEWYTPQQHIDAARAVLGVFDLDPASNPIAQKRVKAERFYTIDDDGLKLPWRGKVWLNPPYAQPAIDQFVRKMVAEVRAGNVTEGVMLTHNYTDTSWFHHAIEAAAAVCFTRGRIKFESPDGKVAAPTQGQAFFYYGPNVAKFAEVFRGFGFIAEVLHGNQ